MFTKKNNDNADNEKIVNYCKNNKLSTAVDLSKVMTIWNFIATTSKSINGLTPEKLKEKFDNVTKYLDLAVKESKDEDFKKSVEQYKKEITLQYEQKLANLPKDIKPSETPRLKK